MNTGFERYTLVFEVNVDRESLIDLIIEAGNDKESYCELATQEDFDRF